MSLSDPAVCSQLTCFSSFTLRTCREWPGFSFLQMFAQIVNEPQNKLEIKIIEWTFHGMPRCWFSRCNLNSKNAVLADVQAKICARVVTAHSELHYWKNSFAMHVQRNGSLLRSCRFLRTWETRSNLVASRAEGYFLQLHTCWRNWIKQCGRSRG